MSTKLKTIILEDDMVSRMMLENYCRNHPDIELIKDFDDVPSAVKFMENEEVDLILLDIQLKNSSGFDILHHLSNGTQVIVTTSSEDYINQAREKGLDNSLLKPIALENFLWSIKKLRKPSPNLI